VSCRFARRFAWNANVPVDEEGTTWRERGFRCRLLDADLEYGDVRCTASRGRVIRWQYGA
jgi:hypothetical protein